MHHIMPYFTSLLKSSDGIFQQHSSRHADLQVQLVVQGRGLVRMGCRRGGIRLLSSVDILRSIMVSEQRGIMVREGAEVAPRAERITYTEWMMKIKSVYYGCDVELDKGIARDFQNNLPESK